MTKKTTPPPEQAIWEAYWNDRTDAARNAVFEHYWPRLRQAAMDILYGRYHILPGSSYAEIEDILSAVAINILEKAIPGCDSAHLETALSYLHSHLKYAIKEYLRTANGLPRRLRAQMLRFSNAKAMAGHNLSRRPVCLDGAEQAGISEKQADQLNIAEHALRFVSSSCGGLWPAKSTLGASTALLDAAIHTETSSAENAVVERLDWQTLMAALGPEEQQFCHWRFQEGYSLRRTAKKMNLTRSQAEGIQKKIGQILRPKYRQIPD